MVAEGSSRQTERAGDQIKKIINCSHKMDVEDGCGGWRPPSVGLPDSLGFST